MKDFFICPLCGNRDVETFGILNGKTYCRKCLPFYGEKAEEIKYTPIVTVADIDYDLTSEQKDISNKVVTNYLKGKNTLIYAVCGAGKTELVFAVIEKALSMGQQIGFTVPRREVVIEIAQRIKNAFPKVRVISVFGDQTDVLTGQIIVLTTHQLYRYPTYFDLLIFDEIDAFPYKGDLVLEALFNKSVRGNFVMLSATPSQKLLKEFVKKGVIITLFTRFHGQKIPVPVAKRGFGVLNFMLLVYYLEHFIKMDKPVLVFVPTIKKANFIYNLLRILVKKGNLVHSKIQDNSTIINDFKRFKYNYLVTTTILERGITIKGLQVIIYSADHVIYDAASLIQIAGRVGRKMEESDGQVIFIITKETDEIKAAISDINTKNTFVQNMFKKAY